MCDCVTWPRESSSFGTCCSLDDEDAQSSLTAALPAARRSPGVRGLCGLLPPSWLAEERRGGVAAPRGGVAPDTVALGDDIHAQSDDIPRVRVRAGTRAVEAAAKREEGKGGDPPRGRRGPHLYGPRSLHHNHSCRLS